MKKKAFLTLIICFLAAEVFSQDGWIYVTSGNDVDFYWQCKNELKDQNRSVIKIVNKSSLKVKINFTPTFIVNSKEFVMPPQTITVPANSSKAGQWEGLVWYPDGGKTCPSGAKVDFKIIKNELPNTTSEMQFICIIKKINSERCGIQTDDITCIYGKYSNTTIDNLKKGMTSGAQSKNIPIPEIINIKLLKGYIGIIMENKYCEAEKKYYPTYTVMQADSESEINNSVKTPANQTPATKKSVYRIINTHINEQPSYNPQKLINYLEQIIGKDNNLIKEIRWTAIGIRG